MSLWVSAAAPDEMEVAPQDASDWEVVDDLLAVEQHIITQSKQHFQQAKGIHLPWLR